MKITEHHAAESTGGGAARPAGDVLVVGAGTWGTALAQTLAYGGVSPALWDADQARLADIVATRRHPFLDDVELSPLLRAAAPPSTDSVAPDTWIILVVPSHVMRPALTSLRDAGVGARGERLVFTAKGLESGTDLTMVEVAEEVFGDSAPNLRERIGVLSGPSHAEEVVRGLPTTVVAAAENADVARGIQGLFMNDRFRVYQQSDVRGVELGGAFKNVYAIAAGTVAGLGFGDNTLAALMTRGLAEMSRLGVAMGADPRTFAGLAGLGDLIVTCTSRHSRNRRFGELRAKGRTPDAAMAEIGQAVEGVRTAGSVHSLAQKHGIEMPIVAAVHAMITSDIDPRDAVTALMTRDAKEEDTLGHG